MQPMIDALARDLGRHHSHRNVRDIIFGIVPGTQRHHRRQIVFQVIDACAIERRNHENSIELRALAHLGRQRQQLLFFLDAINLVQNREQA